MTKSEAATPDDEPETGGVKDKPQARPKRTKLPTPPAAKIPAPNVKTVSTRSRPAESPEAEAARLKREDEDASHNRRLVALTHYVFAGLLTCVTITCLVIMATPGSKYPPETTKLMATLLTAIVSGGASFLAGRAAGKAS